MPYLKGIHLTLDSWRRWRKEDGWKMSMKEIQAVMVEQGWGDMEAPLEPGANKPPLRAKAVPRLEHDVQALVRLTRDMDPLKRLVRPKGSMIALYGFADASGHGFGSTLVINNRVHFHHGQWAKHYDDESSNYRELDNLITAIEEALREGLLLKAELFMFTDNSTAEAAFYKGMPSSP